MSTKIFSGNASTDASPDPGLALELRESLERHRAILDTAVDGIITISEAGLIESFNRAAERIFGYRADEVIGRNVSMLMPEPDRGRHDSYVSNYVQTGRARVIGIGREVTGLRRDGSTFPMDLAIGEVHLPNRRLFTGITRDISDRKAAELEARRRLDDLAHVSRLASMGELASTLAHEVNQPLTAIVTHASACLRMMASGDADFELLRDSMTQIARQGERAGEVIRHIRSFVRKGEIVFAPVRLDRIVREVLWLLGNEISNAGVQVATDLPQQLPAVQAGRVEIEQVVFNLVRNALDALAEVPEARRSMLLRAAVTTLDGVPAVQLWVEDSGSGFGERAPGSLFEAYFTTKDHGLGQGLAICRSLVDAHQGRIWAEARSTGGASFTFVLPLGQAE